MLTRLAPFLVCSSFALLATACVVENNPEPTPGPSASASPGGSSGTGGSTTTTTSPAPMLVLVDTDQTMNAQPGDGVGVFVEYKSGGGWHVWWTCDTNKSSQSCDFDILVSTTSTGLFSNVSQQFASNSQGEQSSLTNDTSGLHISSTTTTDVQGLTFDTSAGAVITIEAHVAGLADGSFLFFVQDGQVNGGYTGALTNPLQFEGSKP